MNNITLELCAEDRARLNHVAEGLGKLAAVFEQMVSHGMPCYMDPRKAEDASRETIASWTQEAEKAIPDPIPTDGPFPDPEPAQAPVTPEKAPKQEEYKLADIQSKVVQLSAAGKKAEVREIVKAYADKVSAIPADKLCEVMAKLTGLEG